jgi:hypothetical protein
MRFFKYGKILAIALPEGMRKSADVKEGEDYEFARIEPGVFLLISRKTVEEKVVKSALAQALSNLAKPAAGKPAQAPVPLEEPVKEAPRYPKTQSPARRSLERNGYAVALNEMEAKELSRELEADVRSGNVKGVRGFDKKFYIVTTEFFSKLAPKISKALEGKKEMPLKDIAEALKVEPTAALACLQVMKEMGDALEKRREVFALVK